MNKLNDEERKIFLRTYQCHMNVLGEEERKKYKLSNIQKIERNFKESCFNVYYKNGDWWHYTFNCQWY